MNTILYLFLISSLCFNNVNALLEDICFGAPSCLTENDEQGIEISMMRQVRNEYDVVIGEKCRTKCVADRKARWRVAMGEAKCGDDKRCDGLSKTTSFSIAEECIDRKACPIDQRQYAINFLNDAGQCVYWCATTRQAVESIVYRDASCGFCPSAEKTKTFWANCLTSAN